MGKPPELGGGWGVDVAGGFAGGGVGEAVEDMEAVPGWGFEVGGFTDEC